MLKAHLLTRDVDTIILCFGANEAFRGSGGLKVFIEDYQTLIDELLSESFNGEASPRLILVSPIPQEDRGRLFADPKTQNESLANYSDSIRKLTETNSLLFVDLYEATEKLMEESGSQALTIDGLQ